MRAVETLENEDGVIFLLDLRDRRFRVVLSAFRRTTVWKLSRQHFLHFNKLGGPVDDVS